MQHESHDGAETMVGVPPVGRRYDIGGRHLFLHRSGSGGPAVVFLAGASAVGLDYLNVHNRVAEFTTSVVYDRAGTGWSDPVDLPRTGAEVTDDLRDVLRAAGVPAPYVLVGHSFGGGCARRYAQRFPDEVAGMLLLEPSYEEWDTFMPEALRMEGRESAPAPLPELGQDVLAALRAMLEGKFADWPESVREQLVEGHLDPRWIQAGMTEGSNLPALFEELRSGGPTPDVPVIVYTGLGIDPAQAYLLPEELLREQNKGKLALFAALVESLPQGEHRVLENGSHSWLHVDCADEVLRAVRDLLDRVAR